VSRSILGAAALAIALGSLASGQPIRDPRDDGPPVPRPPRVKKGPAPNPSKPMSEEYRANVRAQRGFTTRRLEYFRRRYLLKVEAARTGDARKELPTWAEWLEQNRHPSPESKP
jgi:hypothetical protein